jgi:hypothetical protein
VEAELVAFRILHHRPPMTGVAPELEKARAGAGHALHLIVELLLPDGDVEVDAVLDHLGLGHALEVEPRAVVIRVAGGDCALKKRRSFSSTTSASAITPDSSRPETRS